jgi:hypothetical protein
VPLGGEPLERSLGGQTSLLGLLDLVDERCLDRLGGCALTAQPIGLLGEPLELDPHLVGLGGGATKFALGALDAVADRPQLTTHLGRCARRLGAAVIGGREGLGEPFALGAEGFLVGRERLGVGCDLVERDEHFVELGSELRRVGFEIGDDAGTEEGTVVPFERALPLGEDSGEATGPLTELLDMDETIADVVRATCRQLGFERHHLGVEAGEGRFQLGLGLGGAEPIHRDRLELASQRGDLAAGDEDPQLAELTTRIS